MRLLPHGRRPSCITSRAQLPDRRAPDPQCRAPGSSQWVLVIGVPSAALQPQVPTQQDEVLGREWSREAQSELELVDVGHGRHAASAGTEQGKTSVPSSALIYRDGMTQKSLPCLTPTGTCWCGCAKKVGAGSFFAPGHDKVAEAALLAVEYGSSVAQLLHGHGYGPGHSVSARAVSEGVWLTCPACDYVGAPASIANHTKKAHAAAIGEQTQGVER